MPKRLPHIAIALLLSCVSLVSAHPGHGVAGGGHGVEHYLTDPSHLLGGISALAALAFVVRTVWRRRSGDVVRIPDAG